MHPSRTPMHPYMTPMRDSGGWIFYMQPVLLVSSSGQSFHNILIFFCVMISATPIHDGMRTPMRDRAWNPYTPMSPPRFVFDFLRRIYM